MKYRLLLLFLFICARSFSQDIQKLTKLSVDEAYDNIYVKKIADDSLQTSFVIWIKKEVPLHKHAEHSENIYVLSGKGEMRLGDEKFVIKKGDFFNIPKNTPHALIVVSSSPMQVLSIQSPKFLGADRIIISD